MKDVAYYKQVERWAKMPPEDFTKVFLGSFAEQFVETVETMKGDVERLREKKAVSMDWRKKFHRVGELATGDMKMYISSILPEGITAIGSLSAVGKTWFALSMAHALTTASPFLGVFSVAEASNVIYLCPEMGERAFRKRCEKMRVNERFYCQTIADGATPLGDPSLEVAVKELDPIIFFDTAIRFNPSEDENAARQNAGLLASDLFRLIRWGAKANVLLHHSPKAAGEAEFMTLENVLRGTGDMGAMCDGVWGLQHARCKSENNKAWDYDYLDESQQLTRLSVKCVKPRDFEPAPAFRIQGRPYIDDKGDFVVLDDARDPEMEARVIKAIEADPKTGPRELMTQFHIGFERLKEIAKKAGWKSSGKKGWVTTRPF